MKETISNEDWFFLCKRIKKERAIKIIKYAKQYFEPALKQFPELKGKVHLVLRKKGWFADYKPALHIVIREEALVNSSEWRIRSTTAHELLHLVQFINGIGLDKQNNLQIERQATFLSFARNFAYDFLKSFPVECKKETCNHTFKYEYFCCKTIFSKCCKEYSDEKLKLLARRLKKEAKKYSLNDNPDYKNIIYQSLIGGI